MERKMALGGGDLREIRHQWVMNEVITDYMDIYAVIRYGTKGSHRRLSRMINSMMDTAAADAYNSASCEK